MQFLTRNHKCSSLYRRSLAEVKFIYVQTKESIPPKEREALNIRLLERSHQNSQRKTGAWMRKPRAT